MSERLRSILVHAIISAREPVSAADLSRTACVSVHTALRVLREMRASGLVGPTRESGRGVKWTTGHEAAKIRAEWERVRASLASQQRRRRNPWYDRGMTPEARERLAAEIDVWMESQPVRRWVPAGQWQSQGLRQEWHPMSMR